MTIGSTTVQTSGSTGNGATTQFSFSFSVEAYGAVSQAEQIQVIKETIATGVEDIQTLTTHYTTSFNADQASSPGGSITMVTAPSSAYKIWIRLAPSFLQATDYQNQGGFLMETVEDQADQHTRQINVLADRIRRAPRVSIQAGTSFDGEITGDLTAGGWPTLKSDLTGYQWTTNSGSATAVTATGSTAERTLADRAADEINVLDFFLAAHTDHSTAFQAAFDLAFAQRGGTIRVPALTGGYTVNTEIVVTGVVDNGLGWRSGGIRLVGARGTDRNSVFGGDPSCTIRKTSGSGGIFKFVSCDDMTIENVLLETNSATTDYLAKVMAADSPNITGTNVGFKHVEFRTNNTATVDAQVVISATKHTWFEDCYWPDGQSDAVRLGDTVAASPNTLLTGTVYDAMFVRCRFQGDIDLRHVHNLLFNTCEFWGKRSNPDVDYGVRVIPSGDQTTDNIILLNCIADNDGDDTQTFFTQGTDGRNLTVIGGQYGDYDKGFVLNGAGMATFLGTMFDTMATSDIEIGTGNGILLLDHADHGGSPSAGAVVDNRTNFSHTTVPRWDRADLRTLRLNGVISPTQIAADTNNYSPTGIGTAAVWRLSTDARRTITGIVAGGAGSVRILQNIGSFDIVLADESGSSTEANRFELAANTVIPPAGMAAIWYDGTSSRWRLLFLSGHQAERIVYASGVAVPSTNTTAEETLLTITIPGGALGAYGYVEIDASWTFTNGADDKFPRVRIGGTAGTAIFEPTITTSASAHAILLVQNRGAANSQICGSATTSTGGDGASGQALVTAAVDTSADWDLVFRSQKETGTDTLTLERVIVRTHYRATAAG